MKIEKIKIEDIKPYENNAKLYPTEQVEQIKKSIREFGNNDPIAIDENNVLFCLYNLILTLIMIKLQDLRLSILSVIKDIDW